MTSHAACRTVIRGLVAALSTVQPLLQSVQDPDDGSGATLWARFARPAIAAAAPLLEDPLEDPPRRDADGRIPPLPVGDWATTPTCRDDVVSAVNVALLNAVSQVPDGYPLPRGRFVSAGTRAVMGMLDYHGLTSRLIDKTDDRLHDSMYISEADGPYVITCRCGASFASTSDDPVAARLEANAWWIKHCEGTGR